MKSVSTSRAASHRRTNSAVPLEIDVVKPRPVLKVGEDLVVCAHFDRRECASDGVGARKQVFVAALAIVTAEGA